MPGICVGENIDYFGIKATLFCSFTEGFTLRCKASDIGKGMGSWHLETPLFAQAEQIVVEARCLMGLMPALSLRTGTVMRLVQTIGDADFKGGKVYTYDYIVDGMELASVDIYCDENGEFSSSPQFQKQVDFCNRISAFVCGLIWHR